MKTREKASLKAAITMILVAAFVVLCVVVTPIGITILTVIGIALVFIILAIIYKALYFYYHDRN